MGGSTVVKFGGVENTFWKGEVLTCGLAWLRIGEGTGDLLGDLVSSLERVSLLLLISLVKN